MLNYNLGLDVISHSYAYSDTSSISGMKGPREEFNIGHMATQTSEEQLRLNLREPEQQEKHILNEILFELTKVNYEVGNIPVRQVRARLLTIMNVIRLRLALIK